MAHRKDRPTSVVAEFVKTILPRRGGNVLVSGAGTVCFGECADNLQNAFSAASYRTLGGIGRIARAARTVKIAKSGDRKFSNVSSAKLKKVLAFVVYSCYKMNGLLGWRANSRATCKPAVLRLSPSPAYSAL